MSDLRRSVRSMTTTAPCPSSLAGPGRISAGRGLLVATLLAAVVATSGCGGKSNNGIVTASSVVAAASTSTAATPTSPAPAPSTVAPPSSTIPVSNTPTTALTTASPSPAGQDATKALVAVAAQYKKFWTVVDRIGATTSDAHDPALAQVATGFELQRLVLGFETHKNAGTRLYGVSITRVRSVRVAGVTATVNDCHGASNYGLIELKTGKKLTNGFPEVKTIGTMQLVHGVWKVAKVATIAGVRQC